MSFHSVDPTSGELWQIAGLKNTAANLIPYSNTISGLQSNKVQGAIDELAAQNQTLANNVSDINTALGNEVATRSKLGAKNILLSNAVSITTNGITYTVNANGSVTANGTATASAVLLLNENVELPKGQYVFSDNANSTDSNVQFILEVAGGSPRIAACYGSQREQPFSTEQDYTLCCYIWIGNGTTVNNVTFYPMIRLATDASSDYEPYSMTNQELTPIVQAISNPNLLDNPWFTVNQRGQSSYVWDTDIGYRYTVDRWQAYKPNIQVTSNGVVYAYAGGTESGSNFSVFRQFIEDYSYLAGKTVTLSTIVNGTLYKATGVFPSAAGDPSITISLDTGITMYVGFQTGQNYPKVSITNSSTTPITIRAVKLELGSVSTLAMDTAPNYQQELAKCQRYFQIIKSPNNNYKPIGFGYMGETTNARIAIPLSVPMRANPTIVISDLSKFRVYGEAARDVSAMSVIGIENNIVHLSVTVSSSGTKYSPAILADTTKNEYISFSADL